MSFGLSIAVSRQPPPVLCSLALVFIIFSFFTPFTSADYNISASLLSNNRLAFEAPISFAQGDTVYVIGGKSITGEVSNRSIALTLNDTSGEVSARDYVTTNPSPIIAYAQTILLPTTNRVLVFGGYNTTIYQDQARYPMAFHELDIATQTWQQPPIVSQCPLSISNCTITRRYDFTATLAADNNIYIYGGLSREHNTTTGAYLRLVLNDLWVYNTTTAEFTYLNNDVAVDGDIGANLPYSRGHSAVALPNGKIIFMMGATSQEELLLSDRQDPAPCESAWVFDIYARTWITRNTTHADVASSTSDVTVPTLTRGGRVILAPDNKSIYYFGGSANLPIEQSTQKFVFNTLAVVDTETWQWRPHTEYGIPANPRADFVAELLFGKYWVVLGGYSESRFLNDLNIVEFPTSDSNLAVTDETSFRWLSSTAGDGVLAYNHFLAVDDDLYGLNKASLIGISVGFGILALLFMIPCFVFIFGSGPRAVMRSAIGLFWRPRHAEPIWAEILHSIVRAVLSLLLLAYLIYNISLVLSSPTSINSLTTKVSKVQVPDIRFCFDNWHGVDALFVQSDSVSAVQARQWNLITKLDMSVHTPYFSSSRAENISCHLFSAPDEFTLANQLGADNNGTRLKFWYVSPPGYSYDGSRIYISVYPRGMNPNKVVYFGEQEPYLEVGDIEQWLYTESNDFQSMDSYTAEYNTISSISYQLKTQETLVQSEAWNYFGFAEITRQSPAVDTKFQTSSPDADVRAVNTLDLYPAAFLLVNDKESKINTFASIIGPVSGLLSILFVFDAFLFGTRPASPLGIVHNWAIGRIRQSINRSLLSSYGDFGRPVPIIEPVNLSPSFLLPLPVSTDPSSGPRKSATNYLTKAGDYMDLQFSNDDDAASRNSVDTRVASFPPPPSSSSYVDAREFAEMRRRLQLMESMFKAYYIDDEVFYRLYQAHIDYDKDIPLPGGDSQSSMMAEAAAATTTSSSSMSSAQRWRAAFSRRQRHSMSDLQRQPKDKDDDTESQMSLMSTEKRI